MTFALNVYNAFMGKKQALDYAKWAKQFPEENKTYLWVLGLRKNA